MNFRGVTFDELTSDEIAAWSAIQCAEPHLASPYFRPEFTQAVAEVRKHVEVAVLEEQGQPVGFFPFERRRGGHGLPVGTRLSDYHGVIAQRKVEFEPTELIRSCGLKCWHFDHLVSTNPSLDKFSFRHADSPHVDLSQGFEAYEQSKDKHFRSEMRRRRKKVEQTIGPLRFEFDVRDPKIFSTLMAWKIAQYQRTKVTNVFGFPWVRELLQRLLDFKDSNFSATMSALFAGEDIIAVEFMLRSRCVLHSWFSAYDYDMGKYSPGTQLKMRILQAASSHGITLFDMGRGTEAYKRDFQTGATRIYEGTIDPTPVRSSVRSTWWAMRNRVRTTPLFKFVKSPARQLYLLRYWRDLG